MKQIEDRTETEREWIKSIERCPEDIQNHIKNLLQELSLCYEWMGKKEDLAIVGNHFRDKNVIYNRFFVLLNERWLYTIFKKTTKPESHERRCKDCNIILTKIHADSDYCNLHKPLKK